MLGHALQHARHPRVEVAGVAALDQQREAPGRNASRQVPGLQLRAQLLSDALHQVFRGERPDLTLDGREAVRLEVDERTEAGLQRLRRMACRLLDKGGAFHEAGRVVELQRLVQLAGQRLQVPRLGRHAHAHGRLALELEAFELDLHRQLGAGRHQRDRLQRMVRPAALGGGHQGSLERRVTALLEEIHQRLAEQGGRLLVAEQLDPCRVDVHHDALLDVRDRVGGARHEGLHLVPVLAGGCERACERMIEAGGMQLATGDRLEPRARAQGHDILRAELQGLGEVVLGQRVAHQQGGHLRRVALARLERRQRLFGIGRAEEDQLRPALRQRVSQRRQVAHPRAVHRVPGVAERAVDDLNGVLLPGQDHHWNRAGLGQVQSPGGAGTSGAACP